MKILVLALFLAGTLAVPLRKPRLPQGINRIVGGQMSTPGEFPYMVSYQDITWGSAYHFCGGSIYDENNIITAAHCIQFKNLDDPRNVQVVAGEYNLAYFEGNEQVKRVIKIVLHEDYDSDSMSNDIALLHLGTPLKLNDYVQPIPLETSEVVGDCVITGWGSLAEQGPFPGKLMKVTVPAISDVKCREAYGEKIVDSMMCTGGDGGKDACNQDAGGPLSCDGNLAGVVSWRHGCGRPGYPGVYTEVSYFVEWIHKHAK
ncbi:trypsin-1-like [Oratosquilla oratoria]|uniref:trypsin-1-like n=1 Tax=Oratosquilla oratoria TaxID=337810 RepID=UPI003F75DC3C